MEKRRRFGLVALAVVLSAMMLGGCSSVPLISEKKVYSSATLDEQRAWVAAQLDDALEVIGQEDGWYWGFENPRPWPAEREKILQVIPSTKCKSVSGPQPQYLTLDLGNDSPEDPFGAAERIWKHWEEQGWEVRYVIPPISEGGIENYFRADREDGARLSFRANEHYMSVVAISSCSDAASVKYR